MGCLLVIFVVCVLLREIYCFTGKHTHSFVVGHKKPVTKSYLSDLNAETEPKSKVIKVVFSGNKEISTESVPFPTVPEKTLERFFEENKNILLSKDGGVVVIDSPEKEDLELWSKEAKRLGGTEIEVNESDEVLQVTTAMKFPGLKISSDTIFGSKLSRRAEFPEYQFTLLQSSQAAEGLPPSVWLYNKLTGTSKKKKKTRSTASYSLVTINPISEDEFMFTSTASIEVYVSFPSTLMKVLPMSVEKLEEQGSKSIQKAVEQELSINLGRFRDAYLRWLEIF